MQLFTRKIENRIIAVFAGFVLLFSLLYFRLAYLTTSSGLKQVAANQSRYTLVVEEQRGQIYDCRGERLVNRIEKTVYAVLPTSRNLQSVLSAVSPSRRTATAELLQVAKPFLLQSEKPVIAENVVRLTQTQRYEEQQLAPHIIGYLNGKKEGVTGLEKSYDDFLAAHTTKKTATYTVDGLGHSMAGVSPEIGAGSEDGAGVVLSIDKNIQKVIQNIGDQELEKGAIIVMDPYSGELKGVASFPLYTPLDLEQSLQDTARSPMINRAFLPFAMGSTFKIVTAAAALEQGLSLIEAKECTGSVNVGGQVIRCHKRDGHGSLDMLDAMKESCNPYFIYLGQQIGGSALLEMAHRFGFGQGCQLATGMIAASGTLPTEQDLQNPAEIANLSFGQGKLTATPLQVAQMIAAVVNGGYLVTPKLILGTTLDGRSIQREANRVPQQILDGGIASQIQSFLIHCVMVADGQNALPQTTTAGGKTGTAQTGRFDSSGAELEHGWFAGFFPAVNPQYVVVVLSEDTGYGNTTAAPVFSRIADALTRLAEKEK